MNGRWKTRKTGSQQEPDADCFDYVPDPEKPLKREPVYIEDGFYVVESEGVGGTSQEDQEHSSEWGKKKKKKHNVTLTDVEEESVVEWLQENRCLYVKGLREFRDPDKKMKLYQEKANQLNISVEDLRVWFRGMRTRFGRLTGQKNGDVNKEHTERDTWILNKFSFLEKHIARVASRQTCTQKPKAAMSSSSFPPALSPLDEVQDEEEEETSDTGDTNTHEFAPPLPKRPRHFLSTENPTGTTQMSTSQLANRSRNLYSFESRDDGENEENDDIVQQRVDNNTPNRQIETRNNARTAWGQWMLTEMYDIHQSLWQRFQRESFDLISRYMAETAALKQNPEK